MKCAFCLTGKMGIDRNLTAGEIAGQVRVLARELGMLDDRFNIVLMGMGEPLHNYDATMKALRILADEHGLAVSPRRVTLSTVGVLPALERLATEPFMPNLAISLHSTTEDQRDLLVPINRKYGLKELLDACRRFPLKRRERITFEYVMLKDVNDTPEDARRLVRLLHGIKGKVNLLPLNEAAGIPFERPSDERVNRFAEDPRRARRHGLGAQVARPRHPRRLRPADHGIDANRRTWSSAGAADGGDSTDALAADVTRTITRVFLATPGSNPHLQEVVGHDEGAVLERQRRPRRADLRGRESGATARPRSRATAPRVPGSPAPPPCAGIAAAAVPGRSE